MAEKTPEQIAQEKAQKELAEKRAAVAKKNLGSSMWDYATPKLVTHEQYGQLANAAEGFYNEAISKTPDQNVYEQLFLPQLTNEGGAITSPYLQNTSVRIIQESLFSLKAGDAMKYAGFKGAVDEKYAGKYVSELDEKTAGQIVGSAMQYQTDEKVKDILASRQKAIAGGLEKMVGKKEEPAQDKK